MTKMLSKKLRLKTKGLMLVEALFSLFMTILVLFILQNLLTSIKRANLNQNHHMNEVAYAYVQLNRFMRDKNTKLVYPWKDIADSRKTYFTKVNKNNDEETYMIEYYLRRHTIKVSKGTEKGHGGYMPLIFNIKKAKFETTKNQIIIHINEYDKGESDLVFQLDEKPRERDADEKEEKKNKRKCTSE